MAERQGVAAAYQKGGLVLIVPVAKLATRPDENGMYRSAGYTMIENECRLVRLQETTLAGRALREILLESPILPMEEAPSAYDPEFNARLARRLGLRADRSPYAGMKSCDVERKLDEVSMLPLRKLHGGGFEGFTGVWEKGHEDVHVRWSDTDEALGLALQECLARCL